MQAGFFVTGTDTGVGKTYVSVGLLRAFQRLGYSALGIKPVASGCINAGGKLYNEDALALQQASSFTLDYAAINPFAFEPAIAPHLAAAQTGVQLSVARIQEKLQATLDHPMAEIVIVEGAGGWFVPLNQQETIADLVRQLNLPVILVVSIKLGCLNHALLTYQAINSTGLHLAGWVANCFNYQGVESKEIIASLNGWLKTPCLGVINYQDDPQQRLTLQPLLKHSSLIAGLK